MAQTPEAPSRTRSRPSARISTSKLFKQGELGRTILGALRRAEVPVSTADVTAAVTAAIGQPESMRPAMVYRVRGNLAYLERRGVVVKSGAKGGVRWALATSPLLS